MKVYTSLPVEELREIPAQAQRAEALGFDGIAFSELAHDVFLEVALALEHTERIHAGPAITIAFARSPMAIAYASWDLQRLSNGRFELGLGTQVKGHNERRFSVPWTPPAPRMREYAQALRAIWDCYQNGTPLSYQGKHYSFTLMTPEFSPGKIDHPNIPIYIAAVGAAMSRVTGEAYDGVLPHSFTTPKYFQEVTLPQLEEGARRAGRTASDLMIDGGGFIATGPTEETVHRARETIRYRIAWYGSTRTYKVVMDLHEWGDTCLKLHELSVAKDWKAMPKLVTDTMLDTFCISGTYDEIVPKMRERYSSDVSRISLAMPADHRLDDRVGALAEEIRQI